MNRNILYLVVGVLAVAAAVFGYQLYQDRQKTTGIQINVGKKRYLHREEVGLQSSSGALASAIRKMPNDPFAIGVGRGTMLHQALHRG